MKTTIYKALAIIKPDGSIWFDKAGDLSLSEDERMWRGVIIWTGRDPDHYAADANLNRGGRDGTYIALSVEVIEFDDGTFTIR